MCVILVGKVSRELHELALKQNGDGFSLYTEGLGLIKAPTPEQVNRALDVFGIWHYRIATSGIVDQSNVHPFPICNGDYLLYHNGILGKGLGDKSDTRALADMLMHVDIKTASSIIESLTTGNRFLIASASDPTVFRVFGSWVADAGVLLSHKMYTTPVTYSRYRKYGNAASGGSPLVLLGEEDFNDESYGKSSWKGEVYGGRKKKKRK